MPDALLIPISVASEFDTRDVQRLLELYATPIRDRGLPLIYDAGHFARLVGYEEDLLYAITNAPERFYRTFSIKKKGGGKRKLNEPLPTLKEIQRWILANILEHVPVSRAARAYRRGYKLRGNASVHTRQKSVLKMDVRDFFGSIPFRGIQEIFYSFGYTEALSFFLANVCCLDGHLPQGAPTSASLSNIYMKPFDEAMLEFCRKNKLRFTRYADDITISGTFDPGLVKATITAMLNDLSLSIANEKTRVFRRGTRQIVTGLVVNERVGIPREVKRKFRQDVYYIRKFGLDGHMRHSNIMRSQYLEHIMGIGAYIINIEKNSKSLKADFEYLKLLRRTYA